MMKCPNCNKEYQPFLGSRPNDDEVVQDQFPNASAEMREQLLTGICSNKCWDEWLGNVPKKKQPVYGDGMGSVKENIIDMDSFRDQEGIGGPPDE